MVRVELGVLAETETESLWMLQIWVLDYEIVWVDANHQINLWNDKL